MATKRQRGAKRATGRKKPAERRSKAARQRRPAQRRGAQRGARAARREEAALEVQRKGFRLVAPVPTDPDEMSTAPERTGERAEAGTPGITTSVLYGADQAAGRHADPGLPRDDAAELAARGHDAGAALGRWREEAEAARRAAADLEPHGGISGVGLELAIGALRLARTIATAPLRIGLAFLRPRDA